MIYNNKYDNRIQMNNKNEENIQEYINKFNIKKLGIKIH